jgi:haloalkane dehalogenase
MVNRCSGDQATAHDSSRISTPFWRREPDRFLEVEGHRIASWTVGRGPDLLFIHGWPLHSATFRHIVPTLSESYTCHLFDLPATGLTQSPKSLHVSFVGHADIVRGVADGLGLQRYGLVAHDSGGFIARSVAARDSRVAALVSGDTEIPAHRPWQLALYFTVLRAPFGAAA